MSKKLFKKYFNRLIGEGILRSLLCGLTAGFSAVVISALTCWYFAFTEVWLTVVIGLGVTLVTTTVFYFAKYRPDLKAIAMRIDELGLEERVLTMTELEGDDSYIAKRQREDTLSALNTVMPKNIKLSVAAAVLIALPIAGLCMASASTVYGLHVAGLLPSGRDVLLQITAPLPENMNINYLAEGGGVVRGSTQQVVEMGSSGSGVVAVAEEGWAFSHWEWKENGIAQVSTEPYRIESVVEENMTYTAVFTQLEEYQEDIYQDVVGSGDGDSSNSGQDGEDSPFPPMDGGSDPSDNPGGGQNTGSSKDSTSTSKQWEDGETSLSGDIYDDAYEDGMENISQDEDMPSDRKEGMEDYYDSIKK